MKQGRGSPAGYGSMAAVAVAMLGVLVLAHQAQAAQYLVGGSTQEWNFPPTSNTDYYNQVWAKNITFKVGDSIVFTYTVGEHNVIQLPSEADFTACTLDATKTFDSGNDTITLTTAGTFYYVCGFVGHCTQGMKLSVAVAAATPTPAPTVAPVKAPTVAPVKAPTVAPVKAPVKAPAPAPKAVAPVKSPVASPLSSTPTSGPAPSPSSGSEGPGAEAPGKSASPPALQSVTAVVLAASIAVLALVF